MYTQHIHHCLAIDTNIILAYGKQWLAYGKQW